MKEHRHHAVSIQGSWCFRFQQAEDAQQLIDRIIQLGKEFSGTPASLSPMCGKNGSNIPADKGQAPFTKHSWSRNNDSERLKSVMQDVLKDPDLPGVKRLHKRHASLCTVAMQHRSCDVTQPQRRCFHYAVVSIG